MIFLIAAIKAIFSAAVVYIVFISIVIGLVWIVRT